MKPTKEELDEAIRFHREFGSISKRTMDKVVIPILTKYRDGELVEKTERFKMPTDKQVIDFAILFNDGKLEPEKLADMVGMCNLILDRLHENGDVEVPTQKEIDDVTLPTN